MKTSSFITKLLLPVLVVAGMLAAQGMLCAPQDVPLPPKPPDSGPSLADTVKFVEDKLDEQGKMNYVVYIHDDAQGTDGTVSRSSEISKVRASAADCRIDYHWIQEINGEVGSETDRWFPLKDVRDIEVMPIEQRFKEIDSAANHPELSTRTNPPVFDLIVRRPNKVVNEFEFLDETVANRVAKAMVHAVELCGGGNNEPF